MPVEDPIATLDRVPINDKYFELVNKILTAHGATLTVTAEPVPDNILGSAKMYIIHLPPGTTRTNGLVMMRSVPFVLSFPDRYILNASELWPITRLESDTYINVLTFSASEASQ